MQLQRVLEHITIEETRGDLSHDICGVQIDSRQIGKGQMFVAVRGTQNDGHQYISKAIEQGATAIVCETIPEVAYPEVTYIRVTNSEHIVGDIATAFYGYPSTKFKLVGVTGTNGKTTTKELIAAVLSKKFNVLYTQGNFNNDVGVPKTLFRLNNEHEIAVIEMGASHPGDIKTLVETAEPTCGLITNVGRAHLQGFGSFEGVIKTKGELYDFLRSREDSLIFINADNEYLMDQISEDEDIWMSPYSTDPENQYSCISGEIIECNPFLKFRWREPLMILEEEGRSTKWHKVQTKLIGSYNIDNLLAAIAVGINFGVDRKKICAALEEYEPSNNRSQMTVTEKNHLIVDAYNANPSSMQAALENFKLMQAEHKMVILGAMRELGEVSAEEHQHVVDYLKATDVETVWLVGEEFNDAKCDYRKFKDVEEVKAAIAAEKPEGHYILIKGSNSTKLYQLPELL